MVPGDSAGTFREGRWQRILRKKLPIGFGVVERLRRRRLVIEVKERDGV